MKIKLSITCLVLLGCTIKVVQPVKTVTVTATDSVRQIAVVGTKDDSLANWETWVENVKNGLRIDVGRQLATSSWLAEEIEWGGNFTSHARLSVLTWNPNPLLYSVTRKGEADYGERVLIFRWRRDPTSGLWKRRYE